MEKPRAFIHWKEDSYYDAGILVVGSVAIPMVVIITIWSILGGLAFILGFSFGAATTGASVIPFFIMLALTILVGIIIGIVALYLWAADAIRRVNGGRHGY